MTALYQKQQIREIESLVISEKFDDEPGLMNKAGAGAFEVLQSKWPTAQQIIVCCGKGNNAGDGFVLAQRAHEAGLAVTIYTLATLSEYQGTAKAMAQSCVDAGLELIPYDSGLDSRLPVPQRVRGNDVGKHGSDEGEGENDVGNVVIVDAVLGIGIKGEISDSYAAMIQAINASKSPVLAIDVPSGVDVDTGAIYGIAVKADVTITFIALKPGLFTYQAPSYCGEVLYYDLAIPPSCYEKLIPTAELLDWETMKCLLPRRERDTHKGKQGHVLVIGGDYGMGGAVRMAAEAAMRVGAGLVTVATRPEHVSVVNASRPEIMCHEVTKAEDLNPLLEKANVVVIGPGLGQSDWAKMLLERVLSDDHPKVMDADALNLLSENPSTSDQWVLTPHPGEAARLLKSNVQSVQADRFSSAKKLQETYGGVIVLKGVGSIVYSQDNLLKVCPAGNPGMASGGMGDVLSGVIAGLIAQGLTQKEAAELGVLVHAKVFQFFRMSEAIQVKVMNQ